MASNGQKKERVEKINSVVELHHPWSRPRIRRLSKNKTQGKAVTATEDITPGVGAS